MPFHVNSTASDIWYDPLAFGRALRHPALPPKCNCTAYCLLKRRCEPFSDAPCPGNPVEAALSVASSVPQANSSRLTEGAELQFARRGNGLMHPADYICCFLGNKRRWPLTPAILG